MPAHSFARWTHGDAEIEVVEADDALQIFTGPRGSQRLLASYGRGAVKAVLDEHSVAGCRLTIESTESPMHEIDCPPRVCVILLVKLRKYQRVGAPKTAA